MPKICPECQGQASDGAAFCPSCGTGLVVTSPQTEPSYGASPPSTGASGSTTQAYSFSAARWNSADRITGVATLVLLVSLFLPWYSADGVFTVSGLTVHGYLYLVLFVSIGVLLYLGARAGWDRLPISLSISHAPVMLVLSAVNLALVLIGFLFKPGGFGWSVGAWLGLIAAIVAVAPIAVPAVQARRDR